MRRSLPASLLTTLLTLCVFAVVGVGEVKSKTRWDGDKVVSEAHITRKGQGGPYELDVTQKWQVSSDGKTLTNTTNISGQLGARQVKLVYRRAQ
jgi:hypothetical protein